MMCACIFDTETTGGSDPKMIEAAGLILPPGDIDLRPVDSFEQRYNPGVPSTLGALAAHHILDTELEGMPEPSSFTLDSDVGYLLGHNVDYDWEVIGKPEVRRICTLALARDLFPDLDSHTLSALTYHFLPGEQARERLKSAHSAMGDCETTRWLLRYLISALKHFGQPVATWEDLWMASEAARIPKTMPFGKHKGVPMGDLPRDYIDWALRSLNDMDDYLRRALSSAY